MSIKPKLSRFGPIIIFTGLMACIVTMRNSAAPRLLKPKDHLIRGS